MKAIQKILMIGWIAVIVTGCAGTKFDRPTAAELELGVVTKAKIIEKFGKPYRESVMTKNDAIVSSFGYAYAGGGQATKVTGVTPVHATGFYFAQDVLVGHEYISNLVGSSTDFDDSKISSISRGTTTRAQVIGLLGSPSGESMYPMVKERNGTALVYQYVETRGFTHSRKMLTIELNPHGVVTDVTFSKTGTFGK